MNSTRPLNCANAITLLRFLCVPFFIGVMVAHRQASYSLSGSFDLATYRWIALGIFAVAAVSDALDGYVARRFNQQTALGTILDPLADKLLLISAVIMLSLMLGTGERLIPFWFMLVVLSRDFIILIGIIIIFMFKGHVDIQPTRTSKLTTTFQMLSIVLTLAGGHHSVLYSTLAAAAFLTIVSGVQYISIGLHMLHDDHISPPKATRVPC